MISIAYWNPIKNMKKLKFYVCVCSRGNVGGVNSLRSYKRTKELREEKTLFGEERGIK